MDKNLKVGLFNLNAMTSLSLKGPQNAILGNLWIFNRNGMYTVPMIVQLHTIDMSKLSTSPELLDQVKKSMPYKRLSTFYQGFISALRQEVVENMATDDRVKEGNRNVGAKGLPNLRGTCSTQYCRVALKRS